MSAWCSLHSHSLVKLKTSGFTSMELLACVPGAWKEWAKERAGAREGDARVFFSRARFFLCPLLPSACYAGYEAFRSK